MIMQSKIFILSQCSVNDDKPMKYHRIAEYVKEKKNGRMR